MTKKTTNKTKLKGIITTSVRSLRHVPGWRSGNRIRTLFALIGYVFIAVLLVGSFRQSMAWGGISTAIFLFSLVFIFDIGDIWKMLRIPKHDPMSVIFFLAIYLCVISAIVSIFSPLNSPNVERKSPYAYPIPVDAASQGVR